MLKFNFISVFITFFTSQFLLGQNDSLPYETFNNKIIFSLDYGYTSAPFSIKNDFPLGISKIKYRNNFNQVLGFGFNYKWLSLHLSFPLKGTSKNQEKYGNTQAFDLGLDFTKKKTYWDIDLRSYKGYVLKKAYKWNDTLSESKPNLIRNSINSVSFSTNCWFFRNEHFKMEAVIGKTANFIKKVDTWYFKSTFNIYGVGDEKNTLIPTELQNINNSKTSSNSFTAFDFGIVPGYGYANRFKNWQVTSLFGLGPVVQGKFYNVNGMTRGFLGLAPRYDVRIVAGYSNRKYFAFLVTDFDNKSIRFNKLVMRQHFYTIKIITGIRLDKK